MSRPHRPTGHAIRCAVSALIVVAAAVISSEYLRAQAPASPAGTAAVLGRAIDGVTKAAVPGAHVALVADPSSSSRGPAREVVADAQGRFAITAVPEGRYRLTAARAGWMAGAYGMDQPPQPEEPLRFTLTLRGGERVNATLLLWRNAVLSGRVMTEAGEPLGNARVRALQWTVFMGRRRLSGRLASTDDRGAFTLEVPPGEYVLSASSDDARVRGVTPTQPGEAFALETAYFPSSPDVSGAATVSVKSGDDREGLDLRLRLVAARRVAGTLRSVDGATLPNRISISSQDENGLQRATAVGADGRFVFDGLPAGRYVIATLTSGVIAPGRGGVPANGGWARSSIDVGRSDIDVVVDVHRSLRVSGRLRFDGADPGPLSGAVTLTPDTEPAGSDLLPQSFQADSDGRFAIDVNPGRYIVSAGARVPIDPGARPSIDAMQMTPAWRLRSAMIGGRDAADTPLVVTSDVSALALTLTDLSAGLRGRISNIGNNESDVKVLLFPVEESLWTDYGLARRQRLVSPARDGTFAFERLPGGDYYVCAVRGASQRDWRQGALLDVLATIATRVTLDEGVVTSRDLRVVAAPPAPDPRLKPPTLPLEAPDVAETRAVGSQPRGGGSISGRVVDAATNAPIGGMRLSLSPGLEPSVYTDEDGRFLITAVPAGQHTIYSQKASHVATVYGARRPDEPGTPVTVAADQQVTDITFPIARAASIMGIVTDQNGEPMANVEVGVRQYRWQPQGRELTPVRTPGRLGPATTDLHGRFRVYGLAPGDYVVDARVRGAGSFSPVRLTTQSDLDAAAGKPARVVPEPATGMYAPVSYPTAADVARGARLTLAAAEERTLALQMDLMPVAKISGVVLGPDGQAMARVGVQLLNNDPLVAANTTPSRFSSSDAMGRFTIDGVLPGRYTLVGPPPIMNAPGTKLRGALDLTVAGDVDGVTLELHPGQVLGGRIRVDGSAVPPALTNVNLIATRIGAPAGAAAATVTVAWKADGAFTFGDLLPGRYRLGLTGPRNAAMPRIIAQTIAGRDTLNSGIDLGPGAIVDAVDVVVSASPSRLSGTARARDGGPARNRFVILFARETGAWASPAVRVYAAQPDQNGRFIFDDVPPGSYWIAPLADAAPNEWFDPALLARLATGARPVIVSPGETSDVGVVASQPGPPDILKAGTFTEATSNACLAEAEGEGWVCAWTRVESATPRATIRQMRIIERNASTG